MEPHTVALVMSLPTPWGTGEAKGVLTPGEARTIGRKLIEFAEMAGPKRKRRAPAAELATARRAILDPDLGAKMKAALESVVDAHDRKPKRQRAKKGTASAKRRR
jgi:hypothetical protein